MLPNHTMLYRGIFCWLFSLLLVFPFSVSADVRISEPHPHGGFMRATHRSAAFGPHLKDSDAISGSIVAFEVHHKKQKYGCRPFKIPVEASGKDWIALLSRGQCPFEQKVRTAMSMGAMAVIVGNNDDSGLIIMSAKGETPDITIPAVFIDRNDYAGMVRRAHIARQHRKFLYCDLTAEDLGGALTFLHILILLMLAPFCLFCGTYAWMRYKEFCERRKVLAPKKLLKALPTRKYKAPRSGSPSSLREQADQPLLDAASRSVSPKRDATEHIIPIESDCCSICLEDYVDGVMLRALRCRHEFHQSCIDPWLTTRKGVCPVCKTPIDPNYDDGEPRPSASSDGSSPSQTSV